MAAYCRVSTDSDKQETSYETQVSHYTDYIKSHPEWDLAGIFADDGISGTNTKKREQFKASTCRPKMRAILPVVKTTEFLAAVFIEKQKNTIHNQSHRPETIQWELPSRFRPRQ